MQVTPQPGTVLADRYRLLRPLARGGMGSVWSAEHIALNSEVAVKIIDPRIATQSMGVPRFLREARALAALRNPHIVQVIDFGSDGELVYLVMELLEGRTLGQRLKLEGKLSAAETKRILSEVCKAMSHAHERGIVHRDLKPDNIFLCDQSREHVTKVVDFGIAKPMGQTGGNTGTDVGAFLGTPSYMSPEQCRGTNIDQRSDLWALGAIAYECLLGKRLFEGDVVGDLAVRICTEALPVNAGQLPVGFDAWLHRAMARSPDERFQSAPELAAELAAVLDRVSESQKGIDSADTLQVEHPPSRPSAGSTLAQAALVKPAAEPWRAKRASMVLAALAVVFAVALAVVVFRSTASPAPLGQPVAEPDNERALSVASASALRPAGGGEPAHSSSEVSSGLGRATAASDEARPDAGLRGAEAERESAGRPLRVKGPQPVRPLPHRSLAAPARADTVRRGTSESEELRKRR